MPCGSCGVQFYFFFLFCFLPASALCVNVCLCVYNCGCDFFFSWPFATCLLLTPLWLFLSPFVLAVCLLCLVVDNLLLLLYIRGSLRFTTHIMSQYISKFISHSHTFFSLFVFHFSLWLALFPLTSFYSSSSSSHIRTYMDTDTIQGTSNKQTDTQVHMAQLFQIVHGPLFVFSFLLVQPPARPFWFCFSQWIFFSHPSSNCTKHENSLQLSSSHRCCCCCSTLGCFSPLPSPAAGAGCAPRLLFPFTPPCPCPAVTADDFPIPVKATVVCCACARGLFAGKTHLDNKSLSGAGISP